MKKAISLIIICFSFLSSGAGQQTTDVKQNFLAAESYYLFEEFDEALPLYLRLHRTFPDNYNLYFKIGVCYLNDPYEKEKSIFYLEKASENINPKYKDSNFKELGAPLEALFYLGNAYRVNNDLNKARDAYKKFQSRMDASVYDDKLVLEQLAACDAAEKLMKKPVDNDVEILSNQINTRFADKNPAVSGDENRMVFISKLQFYDAVFFTEKKNGEWAPPRNITPELGVDGDVYPTCLSYDGTLLFVYRNDDFVGNLYTSTLVNGLWTPLVKLNDNINTKYWESHASLTKDGNILYFTSNRKGGYGGLDIYKSYKQSNGEWGVPINLGPSVNSAYNEETPFITENGRKLFFSSYGHYNMGGYDVFMSAMKTDSSWSSPVNLGYPVNSTDDDIFFCPVKDGEVAYFPVYKETGYGRHDIYRYKVYTADHPRRYDISGILNYEGEAAQGSDVLISVISQSGGDTLSSVHPDNLGNFKFNIPAGKYSMVFESKRFEKLIKSLEVSPGSPHSGFSLNEKFKLIPLPEKLTGEELDQLLIIKDSLISVTKGKPVEIGYEAEKGSVVVIKRYLDSTLVSVDTVMVDKRRQTYEFTPQPGTNRVEMTLTDKDGNRVTKTATVQYIKEGDTGQVLTTDSNAENAKSEETRTGENNPPQKNINALVNDLASRSEGPLRDVLQNLDTNKEGITNSAELFDYLTKNAEKSGYSRADVDRLMADMVSRKDLEEFLVHLKNAAEEPLKTTISKLDIKSGQINTPYAAVDYLVRNSKNQGYMPEDVVKALATVGSNGEKNQKLFVEKLIHTTDEGALKVYLKDLDLNTLGEGTPQDFAVSLYRNSAGKAFTEADVLKALTNLAASKDANIVLQKLIALSDNKALKDYLTGLDLNEAGIYNADELIANLYANADLKGYSSDDVNTLLQKYLYNQVEEIDDMRLKMASLASGPFKNFLDNLDLNKQSFGSREEFIDYLKSQAVQNGFSEDDVNNALLKLSYNGDLSDIIEQLGTHAGDNLRQTLKELDTQKAGITSFDQLIRYLLENSDKGGYTKDDVYRMLSEYTAATDLDLFMKKLIRLADPETRQYLEKIDLKANGINDRAELISYLLKQAAEGAVNQEKMIRLLLVATDTKLHDILPVLQTRSTGELNKLLNSTRLPVKEFATGADLYDYLIAASEKNKNIQKSEINQIFSEYLTDNALNQFLGTLINHADGKLKEFMQGINLKESGISTVSGLVNYLIQNAAANGYSEEDVFRLIEKVLGRERIQDFVSNLRKYAPAGLARLLDGLDLDKAGINSIEELMKYLESHAAEYGFTMEDVWDAILQMVISGEDKARNVQIENGIAPPQDASKGAIYTGVIFGILGLLILILILIRKKKK